MAIQPQTAEIKPVIIPEDVGSTIAWEKKEPNKWNVDAKELIDGVTTDVTPNGRIKVVDGFGNNLTNAILKPNTTVIELTMLGGEKYEVDIAPSFPQAVADMFLSSVTVDGTDLVLTIANGNPDGSEKVITTSLADLIPVTATDGLTGNGTVADPLKAVAAPSGGVVVTPQGIGLDCANLIQLVNTSGETVLGYIMKEKQCASSTGIVYNNATVYLSNTEAATGYTAANFSEFLLNGLPLFDSNPAVSYSINGGGEVTADKLAETYPQYVDAGVVTIPYGSVVIKYTY